MAKNSKELAALLESPEENERRMALYELEKIGDDSALKQIIALLEDSSWYVRMAAARALGKLGDGSAVDPLLEALDDEYYMVRQNAIWSLGELGPDAEKALPVLEDLGSRLGYYRERDLTSGDVIATTIQRIELAIIEAEEAAAAEGAVETEGGEGKPAAKAQKKRKDRLTPSKLPPEVMERKKREALARKAARASASGE